MSELNIIPQIFCKKKILNNKKRSKKKWPEHNFLFEISSKIFIDRLDLMKKNFSNIYLYNNGEDNSLVNYLSERYGSNSYKILTLDKTINELGDIIIDPEMPILPIETLDLFICNLNLHWINDIPGFLSKISQSLKPGGLFLGSAFGRITLYQLRKAIFLAQSELNTGFSNHISPFIDSQTAAQLLKRAKFDSQICDSEIFQVSYEKLIDLFTDLKNMGENNGFSEDPRIFSKKLLDKTDFYYKENFLDEYKKYIADFEIIFLSAITC